jgi:hypothetical protein
VPERCSTRSLAFWLLLLLALLFIIGAGFNGASFLNYVHDFSSLFMSLGFAIALATLVVGLYLAPKE